MAFTKIADTELVGRGNVGRPDTPGVTTAEMQRILDEIPREVIVPKFNALSGELDAFGENTYTKAQTDAAIDDKVREIGAADMTKAVYDPTNAGLSFADVATIKSELATTKATLESVTCTLPASGWSADAPYTQTVAVAGMTADRSFGPPFVRPTGNRETDEAAKEALACIGGGSTAAGTVTFYCYDAKPEADLTVTMQGVM